MAEFLASHFDSVRSALSGRYTVERELGRGAMATVYLARDERHRRSVAIKILQPELVAAVGPERFLREIQIAAELQHPHIIPLHDSGEAGGLLYYVMPFVEGESLRVRLDRLRQLPVDEAIRITCDIASALDYAHRHEVVHRDVKPENVLMEDGHAVLADFGIARVISRIDRRFAGLPPKPALTATGISPGTPHYMSPEQAAGDSVLDGRSDIYSLGCMLYEMLAGEPPFTGPTGDSVIRQHLVAPPPSVQAIRPATPAFVVNVIERALAKAPADRYPTAAELRSALLAPAENPPVRSVASSPDAISQDGWAAASTVASSAQLTGGFRIRDLVTPRGSRKFAVLLVLVVVALVALGTVTRWRAVASALAIGSDRRPASPEWLVVADFEHPDGDPSLGMAVRELVTSTLEESRTHVVVTRDQLRAARLAALMPDSAELTVERARHLAARTAIRTVVAGRVDRIGASGYNIVVRAIDVTDGTVMATATGAAREETIIPETGRLVRRFRSRLGDRSSLDTSTTRALESITPSFEAFRKMVEAHERNQRGEFAAHRALAREALALDPDFAMAWYSLGVGHLLLGLPDSARLAWAQALRRPGRLTPRQRATLEMTVAADSGDLQRALSLVDRALQEQPFRADLHYRRAGYLPVLGRYDDAAASFQRAMDLSPLGPPPLYIGNYAGFLVGVGRVNEARALSDKLQGAYKQTTPIAIEAAAALTGSDWRKVHALAAAAENDPTSTLPRRARAALSIASAQAARGMIDAANESLTRAAGLFPDASARARVERTRLLLAIASGQAASAPLPRVPGPAVSDSMLTAALWHSVAGDTSTAHHLLRVIRTLHLPVGHAWRPRDVALIEAAIAARGERWRDVVQLLSRSAWRGEPGEANAGSLHTRQWLVAEAYEQLGHVDSAVAFFGLLVTSPRVMWWEQSSRGLTYAFAHRRLALLHMRKGRSAEARHHWEIFLETFTDPDPGFEWMADDARRRLASGS